MNSDVRDDPGLEQVHAVDSRYSNPRELEPKSISPGFPSYIYCNFTLDNSNLPLTRSNFCFPSANF